MAKFKKLAILCVSLMMTAALGTAIGCGDDNSSSSSSSSSSSAPETTEYTVTVTKPENVTIAGTLTAEEGTDVTFTATVDASYVLTATGATQVGVATEAEGKLTYTYKVAAIAEDTAVTITATQIHTSGPLAEQYSEISIPANGSFTGTLTAANGATEYFIAWEKEELVVEINGEEIESEATFPVDGSVQIVFTSSDGAALETELYIAPVPDDPYRIEVGDTVDVEVVNVMLGQIVLFEAEEAGGYIIKLADGSENADIMLYDIDSELPVESSTFFGNVVIEGVEANETVYLWVMNYGDEPTTVSFTVEKHDPQKIDACYTKVGTYEKTVVVNTDTDETVALEAGVYYIAGANESTAINDYDYKTFKIDEDGNFTFSLAYNDLSYPYGSTDEVTAKYDVYKVTEAEAEAEATYGTATLLSNAYTPFTFSVAEAGVYALEYADGVDVALWNADYEDFASAGFGSPYYFVATEENQPFTVYVCKYDDEFESYEFEWDITKVTPIDLRIDSNVQTMNFGDVLVTSFTATEAGAYCIEAGDYVCVGLFVDGKILDHDGNNNFNYGNFYFDLNEGETIYLFLNFDSYQAPDETITQDFKVTRYGNVSERPVTAPDPIDVPPFEGPWCNVAGTISANSEANELGLEINIDAMQGTFTLDWDDRTNVVVYLNGQVYNGEVIEVTMFGMRPTIVAHNTSNDEVTTYFRLLPYIAPLQVGQNYYDLSITMAQYIIVDFEVEAGKTYTFEVTNCKIYGVSEEVPDDNEITSYEATSDATIQLAICKASLDTNATIVVTESATSSQQTERWTKNY